MKTQAAPVYLQIEQDLREKILRGKLKTGERLTEERLSSDYRVSRATLKKSLSILAEEGYLSQIPGRGTFVTSPQENIRTGAARFRKINRGIGVLVPCVTFTIYSGIIRGAEDYMRESGFHIALSSYDVRPETEAECMEILVERGVSGFIIAASYNSHLNSCYGKLLEKNIPFVITDNPVKDIPADLVQTDNVKGGYTGTKHLIASGCKKIAFLSGTLEALSSRERLWGYKDALAEEGIEVKADIIMSDGFDEEFGYGAAMELFKENKIDGVFSANEPITAGILRAVKDSGARVPDDVKIASFDEPDIPPGLNYPFALIKQPRYEIGKIAARMLLERIRESRAGNKLPARKVLLEPELEA